MKHLKLFESFDGLQKEIESLSYIMEDEGIEVKVMKKKRIESDEYQSLQQKLWDASEFDIDFITPESHTNKEYSIEAFNIVEKSYDNLKSNSQFLEYQDRLEEICNMHNLEIKKNYGKNWCMLLLYKKGFSWKVKKQKNVKGETFKNI